MAFNNFMKKVSDAKDKVAGLTVESSAQIMQWLEEYKKTMVSLQVFGLSVGKIRVTAGILPEISTTIRGSLNNIDQNQVQKMLEEKHEEKLLTAILSALLTLTKVREVIEMKVLNDILIEVSLGIPPRVSIDLQ